MDEKRTKWVDRSFIHCHKKNLFVDSRTILHKILKVCKKIHRPFLRATNLQTILFRLILIFCLISSDTLQVLIFACLAVSEPHFYGYCHTCLMLILGKFWCFTLYLNQYITLTIHKNWDRKKDSMRNFQFVLIFNLFGVFTEMVICIVWRHFFRHYKLLHFSII